MNTCSVHTDYQSTCPECITAKRETDSLSPENVDKPIEAVMGTPALPE
jgi:hypothetical protein